MKSSRAILCGAVWLDSAVACGGAVLLGERNQSAPEDASGPGSRGGAGSTVGVDGITDEEASPSFGTQVFAEASPVSSLYAAANGDASPDWIGMAQANADA